MHIWNPCGVFSPLLPYNLRSQFCLFPFKYVLPSLFFILCHLTWSLLVMVTFLHFSPCVKISFYFFGLYLVVIVLHTYVCTTFILPWIFQFMSCGEIPSFSPLLTACDIHCCWIKDNFYIFIGLLKGTFFISWKSTCALVQTVHKQNAVLLAQKL